MLSFSQRLKPCKRFSFFVFMWAMLFSVKSIVILTFVVFLHEMAHVAVCRFLKIRVYGIRSLPWGVTAEVHLINDPISQIAVSMAGPFANFALLIFCPLVEAVFSKETAELFALFNFANGFLNLIPALPLDGGVVLKSFLTSVFGFVRGFKYAIRITAFVGIVIILFGLQFLLVTGFNASYLIAGMFILFNLKHERRLAMCTRMRLFTGEFKSRGAVKRVKADSKSHAICLLEIISPTHITIFKVMENGIYKGELHQERLMECILKNTTITLGECIEKL